MLPLEVYNTPLGTGPNSWKVIIVLEELDIPYEIKWIPYSDIKSEPYISLNPNGRLPALVDPNIKITLFESGAIITYLIGTYDQECKLVYGRDRLQERWLCNNWLHFQMSGQGPMFGQKMWFTHFHKDRGEHMESVLDRYGAEIKRILGVLDSHLQKQRQKLDSGVSEEVWLVGDKCTFADLAFVPWDAILEAGRVFPDGGLDLGKEFPVFWEWHQRVCAREKVKKVLEMREECMSSMEDTAAAVIRKQNQA